VPDDVAREMSRDSQLRQHCDPEVLALRALGESAGTSDDDAHLRSCERCQADLRSLSATVQTARKSEPLESPSPHVWPAIRSELGMASDEPRAAADPAPPADPRPPRPTRGEHRRRRVWPLLVVTALIGVLAGVGATVLAERLRSDSSSNPVAATPLDPFPGWQLRGNAEVTRASGGIRELRVNLTVEESPTSDPGFREVWLIDRQVSKMVSLGILAGDSGIFAVPQGLDLADYPVVDVSFEPLDGQPAHSGESIARGILPT
jgi:anti-sigma-K factor RskA